MSILSLFLVAIGLCFDSFAVSISCGISVCQISRARRLRFAALLAVSQALMPGVGWLLGFGFSDYVQAFDHWIAFVLLTLIAARMVYEALQKRKNDDESTQNFFKLRRQITVAIATSIDALIIGISFALMRMTVSNLLEAMLIIGFVTLVVAVLGMFFGKKVGVKFGIGAEIFGALILFAIGLKMLLEHTLMAAH